MRKTFLVNRLSMLSISLLLALGIAIAYWGKPYLFYLKYIPSIKPTRAKILIVWRDWFGERETIERLKITAKRLNIDLRVVETSTEYMQNTGVSNTARKAAAIFKPDLFIALEPFQRRIQGAPSYMALTLGVERYLYRTNQGAVAFIDETVPRYNGLLYSFKQTEDLKAAFEQHGKKFLGMQWYPTVYRTDFKPAHPNKLIYSGGILWDKTRGSIKYRDLFVLLDKTGYLEVCGDPNKWQQLHNSYIGLIPIDGHSLIERIHDSGVSLVLHDVGHIQSAAPTARIFEAAAANAVIISDKHPFVQEYFGNNVLYIDIDQSAAAMFQQIDAHMQWIKNHPAAAQQLAANCNEIYKRDFALEDQLLRLVELNESQEHAAFYFNKFKSITELDLTQAPMQLQNLLNTNELGHRIWTLLVAKQQQYNFYIDHLAAPGVEKASRIMQTVNNLANNNYKIPDGYYLFSLHDGVHHEYSWPILGFASTEALVAAQKVILIPDNEALSGYADLFRKIDAAKNKYPWDQKISKLFWRGAANGLAATDPLDTIYPRLALMQYVTDKDYIDAKFSNYPGEYSARYRSYLTRNFPLGSYVQPADALKYKYLFDIDGHSCSYERMAWILYSNSLLLKHKSNKVQWYYDKLIANVHYLPIAENFSNMQQQLLWAEQHPQQAQQMISNAQQLAQEVFDPSSLQQALYDGLLNYHTVVSNIN